MKKFFSFFAFAVMAVVASVSFASCSSDDDEQEIIDPVKYANVYEYTLSVGDPFFEYGDVAVTFEYDGKSETFKLDESTKKSDMKHGGMTYSGRELAHTFFFDAKPVKATVKFELNEAGKQKIAAASEDEMLDQFIGVRASMNVQGKTKSMDMSQIFHEVQVTDLESYTDVFNKAFSLSDIKN